MTITSNRASGAIITLACCAAAAGQSYTVEIPAHPAGWASSSAFATEGGVVAGSAWSGSTYRAQRWEGGGAAISTCGSQIASTPSINPPNAGLRISGIGSKRKKRSREPENTSTYT